MASCFSKKGKEILIGSVVQKYRGKDYMLNKYQKREPGWLYLETLFVRLKRTWLPPTMA